MAHITPIYSLYNHRPCSRKAEYFLYGAVEEEEEEP